MQNGQGVQPFLKWAGGKRQLLGEIRKYLPTQFNTYYEPFLGGGAVLFALQPQKAVINDINEELCNCYLAVRDQLEDLLACLAKHKNEKDYYYYIRDLDRQKEYQFLSLVEKAARIIYLNKTCYNGLFRVNSQGQFNVPFGKYKNPKFLDEPLLRAVNAYLANNQITIHSLDFNTSLKEAGEGDFIYFDPPYHPLSETSSFTGYSINGFGKKQQLRLQETFTDLDRRGCKVLLSNSATEFIFDLYRDYEIITVSANRSINSVAAGRGKINEVLVKNYAH